MPDLDRLGEAPSGAYSAALRRALGPMVRQVQQSLPQITSPGHARALGVALARTWPEARILRDLLQIGAKAEAAASRPWAPLERRLDGARLDAEPYDGRALVVAWAREAASRITSVRSEVARGLEADVVDALERGIKPEALAARWARQGVPLRWGTLEGRTKVIAQHQLSILHANVQRERARAAGVREFIWTTRGDENVRARHAALDGTRHEYESPPPIGLPGHEVNCRCHARSVIPPELLRRGPRLGQVPRRARS